MSLYFTLLLASVAVPLLLSFDKRLQFYKKWKFVIPAVFIVGAMYIAFDVYLTRVGVWGFNPRYLSEIYFFNLPIEEWLFFIAIAYASLFLHFSIIEYFPKVKPGQKAAKTLTVTLIAASLLLVVFNTNKQYTSYIFIKIAIVLALALFDKSKSINSFYVTFLVILIPFIVVNGILTGSFIEEEVVWYNNDENLGIRFLTIPVEDFGYAFSLLLFNLLLLTKFEKRFNR